MSGDVHVYRINTARMLVLPAIWLVLVAVLLGVLGSSDQAEESAAGMATAAIITLIIAPIFYFAVWRSRLELDPNGIVQFQFGYTVRSSWANLQRLSLQPGSEALLLAAPGTHSGLLRASTRIVQGMGWLGAVGATSDDADALAQGRLITLAPFTSHLRGGPLRHDLERWAPQLFATGGPS